MSFKSKISHLFHPGKSNNHRPKILHPESYAFFVVMAIAFFVGITSIRHWPSAFQGVLGFSSTITASQVIEQTNQERQAAGLNELTVNDKLTQAALAKAQHIFDNQYWAHVAPDGTEPWDFFNQMKYSYKAAGENLARDFSNTDDMVAAWMASPTHRDNILNGKYNEIGIAVVDGDLLGYETTLVVQMFGSQMNSTTNVGLIPDSLVAQHALELEGELEPSIDFAVLAAAPVENENKQPSVTIVLPEITKPPLFSPLQLIKALFLAIILLIMSTLIYDTLIIQNTNTVRLVGKNIAHIMFFMAIAYIIIFFKGGIIS